MVTAPWGGSEVLWSAAAREALRDGHEVFVSVEQWPALPPPIVSLEQAGAHVVRRRSLDSPTRSLAVRAVRKLHHMLPRQPASRWRRLIEFEPDAICLSQGSAYDFLWPPDGLGPLLHQWGRPYLVVSHTNSESLNLSEADRRWAATFFARANRVAFVAERTLRLAERQLAATIPNAVIVRNPVNLTDRAIVDWPDQGEVTLAAVGRVEIEKGIDALFETLSSSSWRERNWRLRLYGSICQPEYFSQLARFHGLADKVEFCGYAADVRRVWADNQLLVLPSRQESAPLSLVEAMLCGRPAVATDVGGVREWLDDSRTGFLAASPMPQQLDAALQRAWDVRAQWPQLGRIAHDKASALIGPDPARSPLEMLISAAR
jgi:L-malate glycosyltransferase